MDYFDLHCDTVSALLQRGGSLLKNTGHVDLDRFGAYNKRAQVFALWSGGEDDADFPALGERLYKTFLAACRDADAMCFARSADDLVCAQRAGRLAAFLSIEGAELIGTRAGDLARWAQRGVRFLTIAWNRENAFCDCAVRDRGIGLTDEGRALVREAERLGVTIDVSHMSEKGFYDLAAMAQKPFVASHSNAYALRPHRRNLTDRQIETIARCGGLIGLNAYRPFVTDGSDGVTLADHYAHIRAIGGDGICAFGCDFDGCDELYGGVRGIQDIKVLVRELQEADKSETAMRAVCYENAAAWVKGRMR